MAVPSDEIARMIVDPRVSRDEVLTLLRDNLPEILPRITAIPDEQLDITRETPAGPMSVAQRLERVLIGHMKIHEESIRAAIASK